MADMELASSILVQAHADRRMAAPTEGLDAALSRGAGHPLQRDSGYLPPRPWAL